MRVLHKNTWIFNEHHKPQHKHSICLLHALFMPTIYEANKVCFSRSTVRGRALLELEHRYVRRVALTLEASVAAVALASMR